MKILGKIAFYCLFAFGAIRLFSGLSHLWPLLYGNANQQLPASEGSQRRYYRFDNFEAVPMDKTQVGLMIFTGLAMILMAFYIRKKTEEGMNGEKTGP
ncbi:MAG: hypothetical protein IT258_01110 [Saprospiraceae bacterium]|nr:hypothetical protein [Saprospiraceae bacterium]